MLSAVIAEANQMASINKNYCLTLLEAGSLNYILLETHRLDSTCSPPTWGCWLTLQLPLSSMDMIATTVLLPLDTLPGHPLYLCVIIS